METLKILSNILFWAVVLIVAAIIIVALFTIFYHKYLYPVKLRNRYNKPVSLKCSIIIPCKGIIKNFKTNIESFLNLDYDNYEVIYCVESEQDPAYPILRDITKNASNASVIVAGFSSRCGQKNWNLLAGVKACSNPDVYVFADSDIGPQKNWLRELIMPLSDPSVSMTTGYRWLKVNEGTIGELVHYYANAFIYSLFSFASFTAGVGLWGGSMAVRKKDFDEIGTASRWAETVADDSSLAELALKYRKKTVLVSTAITLSDDTIRNSWAAVLWLQRQIMSLKYYHQLLWLLIGLPVSLISFSAFMWLPFSGIMSILTQKNFFELGGGIPILYFFGEVATAFMLGFVGEKPKQIKFLLLVPLLRFLHLISYFGTYFKKTILWSGIRYRMNFSGTVAAIERNV